MLTSVHYIPAMQTTAYPPSVILHMLFVWWPSGRVSLFHYATSMSWKYLESLLKATMRWFPLLLLHTKYSTQSGPSFHYAIKSIQVHPLQVKSWVSNIFNGLTSVDPFPLKANWDLEVHMVDIPEGAISPSLHSSVCLYRSQWGKNNVCWWYNAWNLRLQKLCAFHEVKEDLLFQIIPLVNSLSFSQSTKLWKRTSKL